MIQYHGVQGEVAMQLYQGAIGTIRLSEAQARASLNAEQQLSFNIDLAPELRQGGSIQVSGLLPLLPVLPVVSYPPHKLTANTIYSRSPVQGTCVYTSDVWRSHFAQPVRIAFGNAQYLT